jgi:hypothetical protein
MDRLIQIHEGVTNVEVRRNALWEMVDQINPERALPYLERVATSSDEDGAAYAVQQIGRLAYGLKTSRASESDRAKAQSLLRRLVEGTQVRSQRAALKLCEIAATQKWRSGRRCAGIL